MIKTFKHITILLLLLSNNQAAAFYHHVSQSPLSFVRRHSCCHRSRGTSIIWRWHWYQHLLLILQQRHSSSSLISCLPSQAGSSSDEFESSNNCNIQGEIIGSTGRIGSFLLRSAATSSTPSSTESIFAIIAKGERPGLSSPINTPIYVAIPATLVTRGKHIYMLLLLFFQMSNRLLYTLKCLQLSSIWICDVFDCLRIMSCMYDDEWN